ncbi:MAG: trypsin-like serine protease [Phycisphaerales bacterium]|nr:trypsin-like serine protease [Phycisphaerales bacterium]
MRLLITTAVILFGGAIEVGAQETPNRPYPEPEAYQHDSGTKASLIAATATVHDHEVIVEDAVWLRIHFSEVQLEKGSFIRMTSVQDGEVQELDAAGLAMWSNASAYFNGNAVLVELVAEPGTSRNRFVIDKVASKRTGAVQIRGGGGQCGICGGSDDRVPSSEVWTGRLAPGGCTASVWNAESCLVTAGHCVAGANAVHFNVPNSNPNCIVNQPPIADQFPITNVLSSNFGPGDDWAVMTTGTNNLGQTIFQRYGEFRPIASSPGVVGQQCELTGYGVDLTCTLSETQQTASGPITSVFAASYRFGIDLRGGNSGSALMLNDEIIGIATHCPCNNIATRVDLQAFADAREALCPTDCNSNSIPDICDLDCGPAAGPCDVPGCGQSLDCNENDIPDDCEGGDLCPPTPNPMTFAALPPATMSDTQIMFEANVATDDTAGVEYYFDKQFGPGCCGTDSGWIASDTHLATGLLANSSYSYKVRARDTSPNLNETALSDLFATGSTFIETPFDIALVNAQETEITVIITCNDTGDSNRCVLGSFTNLFANPPSGLFLDMAPLEGSGSNAWTDQQTITVTGLTPGTDYTFKAKARNRLSVETAFSGEFIFSTLGGGCPTVAGDLNQDGDVDGDDIAGYIRAKLGVSAEPGEEQNCADFGNGPDISAETAAFVAALLS